MGDCILRRCELGDIIPVMEINLRTLPEHYSDYFYESLLSELPEAFIVAEVAGKHVGYIMCKTEFGNVELFQHPRMQDLKNVTFETNTTQHLYDELFDYFNNNDNLKVTFSCSPKLSVSGESWDDAIKPNNAYEYNILDASDVYLKFVVSNRNDVDEVTRAVQQYRDAGLECPVYLMPLGGRSEEYTLNVKEVAEACMERGWRFTPRLHISLFGNAWGT